MATDVRATLTFRLPGSLSLDGRDSLVEKVRETAYPALSADGRDLTIVWESDPETENAWLLRGRAEETKQEIEAELGPIFVELDLDQAVLS